MGGGISTATVGGYTDATARILASDGLNLNERGVRLDEAAKDHKVLEQPVYVLLARRTVSWGRKLLGSSGGTFQRFLNVSEA